MAWKNLKRWLRGGIIGLILSMVFFLIGFLGLINFPCKGYFCLFGYPLLFFVVMAIIGQIYEYVRYHPLENKSKIIVIVLASIILILSLIFMFVVASNPLNKNYKIINVLFFSGPALIISLVILVLSLMSVLSKKQNLFLEGFVSAFSIIFIIPLVVIIHAWSGPPSIGPMAGWGEMMLTIISYVSGFMVSLITGIIFGFIVKKSNKAR